MMTQLNLEDLSSKDPQVKYACAKNLLALAKDDPATLYPEFDHLVELLDSNNNIFKWTAIDLIGHFAKVDRAKKVDNLISILFSCLKSGKLVMVSHAVGALAEIALAKPEHKDEITAELLDVETHKYETNKCRDIAIGKTILALDKYVDTLEDQTGVFSFVERQKEQADSATKKKAEKFLKRHK